VDESQQTESQRRPADELAGTRAVAVRMTQGSPGQQEQQDRHDRGGGADSTGDDSPDDLRDRAVDVPPDGGRNHDAGTDQRQPDTVAPMGDIELTRTRADAPDEATDQVRDTHPQRAEHAADAAGRPRRYAASGGRKPSLGSRSTRPASGRRPTITAAGRRLRR
jgi:hypothetical protein